VATGSSSGGIISRAIASVSIAQSYQKTTFRVYTVSRAGQVGVGFGAQSERRSPEPPFAVFARAVDCGKVCLELDGDSVSGEVANDQTWRALIEAAAAHPESVAGITLAADDGLAAPVGPMMLANDDLRDHLAARLISRDWWIFISASASATAGCLFEIERRFYGGSANADFELAIVPWRLGRPMAVIACGHKRRLPIRELIPTLARFMKPEMLETTRIAAVAAEKREVLILDDARPMSSRALLMAFLEFLQLGAALRAAMRN
jgi:hypothetical protein